MILWQLFFAFLKIGFFTIGGGYAMLALIQEEIARYGWMTSSEFVDIVGIAEMTPGPIAVNAATFIGYRAGGLTGSFLATGAVVLPSLVSVLLVSRFWERYKSSRNVQAVFAGIRPVIAGLVGAAAVLVGQTSLQVLKPGGIHLPTLLMAIVVFIGLLYKKWDPIKVLVICAVLGLIIFK